MGSDIGVAGGHPLAPATDEERTALEAVRGFAGSLVDESRRRGFEQYGIEELEEIAKLRIASLRVLLGSSDPMMQNRGQRALGNLQRELGRFRSLEVDLIKTGTEAAMARQLVRMRMGEDGGDGAGVTADEMSKGIEDMVRENGLKGEDDENGDGNTDQAEA